MADPILVVIPTRDRPAMLSEALATVCAQTDPDWVAVVADDGDGPPARDAIPAAIRDDSRIAFLRTAARSPGGARNAAIRRGIEMRGTTPSLVAFLDDDDLWLPGHLAASRAALATAPDAPFVHGAAVTRDGDLESSYHARDAGPFDGDLFRALVRRDVVATSSVVARGDALLAEGLFREDLRHTQDWDLWLKLSRRGPIAFVPETTVVYRNHDGNISHRLVSKNEDQVATLEHWWRRRHRLLPADRRLLRGEWARRMRRHVKRLLAERRLPRADVRRIAARHVARLPHPRTLLAWLEAALPLPRGH